MPNDFPFSAFACGASGNSRKQAAVSILASGGTVWTCRAKEGSAEYATPSIPTQDALLQSTVIGTSVIDVCVFEYQVSICGWLYHHENVPSRGYTCLESDGRFERGIRRLD